MKNKLKINIKLLHISLVLLGLSFAIVEVSFLNLLPFATPHITFIFLCILSLYLDKHLIIPTMAIFLGYVLDFLAGKYIGQNALIFFVCSMVAQNLSGQIRRDSYHVPLFIVCAFLIVESIYSYIVGYTISTHPVKMISIFFSMNLRFFTVDFITSFCIIIVITFISKKRLGDI